MSTESVDNRTDAQPTPDGWKLVPIEPTQEMVRHAYAAQPGAINAGFAQAYCAMLEAAPYPTAQPPAAPVETTGIMQAAESAAKTVEGWSDSKRAYADRVVGTVAHPRLSAGSGEVPFTNPNHAKTCALYWDKLLQGINSACGCGGLAKDRQLKAGSGGDQPASAAEWRDNYNACWDRARSEVKHDALKSAALKALNYIENTENELGIKLSCGDALREVLR